MRKIKHQLNNRDLEILNILWESPIPLTAPQIIAVSKEIPANTVYATLKKLLDNKYIKVADHILHGHMVSRAYKPAITAADYEAQRVFNTMKDSTMHSFSASGFIRAFLNQETDKETALRDIDELEKLLNEKRKELNDK